MRTTVWIVGLVLVVGCQRNRARDCAPYAHDPVLDVCVCPEGTLRADGGADCIEYDGGAPLSCAGGAAPITVYADADGDGHGNPETERMGCPGEPDTSMLADDCDDACETCHPGGTEICDGEDNDCAAGPDDTFACVQGTTTACTTTCGTTGTGACSPECTMPGACTPPSETCNELDDDCDELVDEGALGVGSEIPWPTISGHASIVATADGLVVLYTTSAEDALWAQRYMSPEVASGAPVMIASGNVDSLDATVLSSSEIAFVIEDGDRALVGAIDPRNLATLVAPREIASRPALSSVRIVRNVVTFVVYAGASGAIYQRAFFDIGVDTPAERTIVANRTGLSPSFDVTTTIASLERVYVAYSDTPAGESDQEVYALVTGMTGPLSPAMRITNNDVADATPTIAANRSGLLAVAWLESTGSSTAVGDLRISTLTHDAGGFSERARSGPIAARTTDLSGPQIALIEDPRGWLIAYPTPILDITGTETRARYLSPTLRSTGAELVPVLGSAGFLDLTLGLVRVGSTAWLVNRRADSLLEGGEARAFPLGCL